MKNTIFSGFMIMIVSLISCKQSDQIDCDLIDELISKDQFYRKKHANLTSPFFFTLDSLLKVDGYPAGIDELSNYDDAMVSNKREMARNIIDARPEPNQNKLDSIWALQNKQDELNTLQMIDLVKTFGLVALDSLQNGCAMEGFIIFVHSPDHLKSQVQEIIDPGLLEIDKNRHRHIMWHINGRN